LSRLHLALLDRLHGAKPKLLLEKPALPGAKGAPTHTSSTPLRAFVNFAYITLCSGVHPSEAARWLAAELERVGIRQTNGEKIAARAIVRWCAERGAKSLKGSDELLTALFSNPSRSLRQYRNVREKYQRTHPDYTLPTATRAKEATKGLIKVMKIAGF
jgi:hypothetical protein